MEENLEPKIDLGSCIQPAFPSLNFNAFVWRTQSSVMVMNLQAARATVLESLLDNATNSCGPFKISFSYMNN